MWTEIYSNFHSDLSANSIAFTNSSSRISFFGRFLLCAVLVWPYNRNSLSIIINVYVFLVWFSDFSIKYWNVGLLLRKSFDGLIEKEGKINQIKIEILFEILSTVFLRSIQMNFEFFLPIFCLFKSWKTNWMHSICVEHYSWHSGRLHSSFSFVSVANGFQINLKRSTMNLTNAIGICIQLECNTY